jgi:hypothetical protein
MLAPVPSISRIRVLGLPPSWYTFMLIACLGILYSNVHTHFRVTNLTYVAIAKQELVMITLRKVKSVKTILSNTHFIQISKSTQDLV